MVKKWIHSKKWTILLKKFSDGIIVSRWRNINYIIQKWNGLITSWFKYLKREGHRAFWPEGRNLLNSHMALFLTLSFLSYLRSNWKKVSKKNYLQMAQIYEEKNISNTTLRFQLVSVGPLSLVILQLKYCFFGWDTTDSQYKWYLLYHFPLLVYLCII